MFLKKSLSRNGRYFLSFVQGYRENGKNKHKTIENIGWLDELEKQYDNPIEHFKEVAKQKTLESNEDKIIKEIKNEKLSITNNNFNVGYVVLKKIYEELSFKDYFKDKQKALNIKYDLNSIFSLLIYSRIMYPGSKKETYDNKDRFFEPFNFSLKDMYRALDHFDNFKEEIQKLIWNKTKDIYNRDTSNAYYDCTNYYFEIDYNDEDLVDEEGNVLEKGYRKRGPEKNKRPDPIIEMGLLMDKNGIPISYDIFPGNESEKTSLRPIINKTKSKFNLGKVIVVADRGLNTSDNTFFLAGKNDDDHSNHDGYVYGQSVRGADKEFKDWVLEQDGYINEFTYDKNGEVENFRARIYDDNNQFIGYEKKPLIFRHKSRIYAKEVKIKKDGKRIVKTIIYQKQMVYYSQKYADKQKRDREQMIEKARDLIKNPAKYNRATSYGAAAYINNIKFHKETGEIPDGLELSIKEEKIKEEEKFDGYYSIVTSEKDMSDKEMRDVYRGLGKIEESFKITKSNFESRPVYVWTKEHIEAHFLTCFVSLVIIRLLEQKMNQKYSVDKIINTLKDYNCSYLDENYYLFSFRNEIIEVIEEIFDIDLSNKILTRKKIKKLLKY